jgi:hypothetical protein
MKNLHLIYSRLGRGRFRFASHHFINLLLHLFGIHQPFSFLFILFEQQVAIWIKGNFWLMPTAVLLRLPNIDSFLYFIYSKPVLCGDEPKTTIKTMPFGMTSPRPAGSACK